MFEIIKITLEGVGYAVFNMPFIIGIWFIYSITKKMNSLDYYRTVRKNPFIYLISDIILQGILVGIVVSLTLVLIGVPLYYNEMLLMIIPISLLLSIYRMRLLCITYSASMLAFLSMVFNGQEIFGMTLFDVEVHVPSLIILVGVLHLAEGLLVLLSGHKRAVTILSKKDDQIIMGHIIHKNWAIPLGLIVLQIGTLTGGGVEMPTWWPMIKYTGYGTGIFYSLMPLIGMLSYSTIVYSETPRERSRISGLSIMAFSAITIFVGTIAVYIPFIQFFGVMAMLFIHEGLYYLETKREESNKPIYTKPKEGVRIMQVIEGGFAAKVGMEKGDIIHKINEELIQDLSHFIEMIKDKKEKVSIETITLSGRKKHYKVDDFKELEHMGIRVIPEKPLMLHPYNQHHKQGVFEFLKKV